MGVAGVKKQKKTPWRPKNWFSKGFIGFGDDILNKKKKATPIGMTFLLVREAGLEPARPQ